MPSKSTSDIKKGNLVWILYRKQPWPAMVKCVYPKKITYNFLPVSNHPNVFSTTLKNVRHFLPSDKLPSGASEDQQEAYNIAIELASGVEPSKSDSTTAAFESATEELEEVGEEKVKPAGKRNGTKTHAAAKAKATSSKATEPETSPFFESDDEVDEAFVAENVEYAPGDVAIVDTTLGAWPVRVTEVEDKNAIIYELFAPSASANGRATLDKVHKFPTDVDQLIAENIGSPKLCKAFKNVKTYLQSNGSFVKADDKSVEEDEEKAEEEEEKADEEPPKPKKGKNIVKTVAKPPVKKFSIESKASSNAATKPTTNVSKKKAAEKPVQKEEKVGVVSKRPTRKRRHVVEKLSSDDDDGEEKEMTNKKENKAKKEEKVALLPDSSADFIVKKRNAHIESAAAFVSSTTKQKRANAAEDIRPGSTINGSSANGKKLEGKAAMKHEASPVSMTTVTRRRLGMNRGMEAVSPRREEALEPKLEPAETAKPKTPDFMQTLLSHDASAHLNAIWTGGKKALRAESSAYMPPTSVDGLDLNFGRFSCLFASADELHESVTEIRKWTQLCTKLPKMALLTELHYIANVVLPEACVFALSKIKKCTLNDAATNFERIIAEKSSSSEKVDTEIITLKSNLHKSNSTLASPPANSNALSESRSGSASTNSKLQNGLHELVLAASMMAKSAGDGPELVNNKSLNFNSSCEGGMFIVEEDDN